MDTGQLWVKLNTVMDSAESSLTLSWTALSQAKHCPRQRRVKLNTVKDSAESSLTLSMTSQVNETTLKFLVFHHFHRILIGGKYVKKLS